MLPEVQHQRLLHNRQSNLKSEERKKEVMKIMMHDKTTLRFGAGLLVRAVALLVIGGAVSSAMAQVTQTSQTTKKRVYSGRDPFKRYEPPPVPVKRSGQVTPPPIEARIDLYKAQKLAAMRARMPAPKPTTALLLSELQVIGISRTPRGYAAIVEAMPIKLSYVIYPGEPFYDGQLVAIEDSRLIFRREVVFSDGHRERSVEMKPLRQPNSVNPMAVSGPAVATPEGEAPKNDEKAVATAKP